MNTGATSLRGGGREALRNRLWLAAMEPARSSPGPAAPLLASSAARETMLQKGNGDGSFWVTLLIVWLFLFGILTLVKIQIILGGFLYEVGVGFS